MDIRVQEAAFDPGAHLSAFTARQQGAGAVVSFTGLTRDLGGTLETMEIEHYPGMTEKALAALADEARSRWSLEDVFILHRHGHLRAGEPIMMVATAALHRKPAFEAADFLMDYLKSRAPFWKKEITRDAATWVDAKDTDEAALSQWTR
ncbi:MAG: molybdenum cofactor biosynthesis protein MoaE [Pseudomonadota bacterium]